MQDAGPAGRDLLEASPLVAEVRELLRRGAVDGAAARVAARLAEAPASADAWYLAGVVANRRREHAAAIDALRRAIDLDPAQALPWLALGTAYARSDAWADAASAYREAIARDPSLADAHFNLGLALRHQGDLPAAMRALHAAWSRDPMFVDAARQCVAAAAEWVRRGGVKRVPAPSVETAERPSFTVVLCSIDAAKATRAAALYRRLFAAFPHEIRAVAHPPSLAQAYNDAVRASEARYVVMSHDDIDVLDDDFAPRLARLLGSYDGVGVVGSTRMDGPAVGWSGHPHLRGWITHRAPGDAGWRVDVLDPRPVADGIAVLDGVLLAASREMLRAVPFDESAFDGFHLYDLDWSYRASRAGYRLAAAGELLLVHASRGGYGAAWERYAARFCAKHGVRPGEPAPSSFHGATLASADEARAFFATLGELAREAGASSR